jgi:hypothetical protein
VQPLMCYFHMLRGNAEKGVLFQDIGELWHEVCTHV